MCLSVLLVHSSLMYWRQLHITYIMHIVLDWFLGSTFAYKLSVYSWKLIVYKCPGQHGRNPACKEVSLQRFARVVFQAMIHPGLILEKWLGSLLSNFYFQKLAALFFFCQVTTQGKLLFTHVPLSPSSIICYRPNRQEGNSSIWQRCGLPPV